MERRSQASLSVLELFQEAVNHGNGLKSVDSAIVQQDDWFLFDLSLSESVADKEEKYAQDKFLRKNLRGGNTVIVNLELLRQNARCPKDRLYKYGRDNYHVNSAHWGRRGLFKIFDLDYGFTQHRKFANFDEVGSFTKNNLNMFKGNEAYKNQIRQIMFQDVERGLLNSQLITVYKTTMVDGESAQISYFKIIDKWIIASQNTSIAVRNASEISFYGLTRFKDACQVAIVWFQILDFFTNEQIASLKDEMAGKTLIGTHVGNYDKQKIVRYNKEMIVFYAISSHSSNETCIPVLAAYDLFKRYGLTYSRCMNMGSYDSIAALYQTLDHEVRRVY